MSKERDVQSLEHKIAMLERRINDLEESGKNKRMQKDLLMKKLKYETELEEIQFS